MPPFLLGGSYGDARMGMARILGFCFAFLFASSVAAAVTIDLGPSDYRSFGPNGAHTSAGIRSSFGQNVRLPPTLGTLSVTRNPVIPYGSIANGLKNFTRLNPVSVGVSAAITGLFLAVDWVFDEATGQWSKMDSTAVGGMQDPVWCYSNSSGCPTQYRGYTPIESCLLWQPYTVSAEYVSNSRFACRQADGSYFFTFQIQTPQCVVGNYDPSLGYCSVMAPVPLTDADFDVLEGELVTLPPALVSEAAGDVQRRIGDPLPGYQDQTMTGPSEVSGSDTTSTSTDPITGDTVVTNTSSTTNISYGDTTITTTNTTTTTTYQNGQETSTTVTTETPGDLTVVGGGGGAGDWPEFCDWATVICDWLIWTQEPPPDDLDLPQLIDEDFYAQKRISFGAKSCPPDHEINLAPFLETTVGVSFQPLCDFAGLIYYMVMAASYIIAAYISIGVARNV